MNYIVNKSNDMILIMGMTLPKGAKMPVINDKILELEETKALLAKGKIEVIKQNGEGG